MCTARSHGQTSLSKRWRTLRTIFRGSVCNAVDKVGTLFGISDTTIKVLLAGRPLVQFYQLGQLYEHYGRIEHPVYKDYFFWRTVTDRRVKIVGHPLGIVAVAAVLVQVLRQHRSTCEPLPDDLASRSVAIHAWCRSAPASRCSAESLGPFARARA